RFLRALSYGQSAQRTKGFQNSRPNCHKRRYMTAHANLHLQLLYFDVTCRPTMAKLRSSNRKGFTLLELITAIALFGIFSTASVKLASALFKHEKVNEDRSALVEAALLLNANVERLMTAYDSQPLELPPHIHDPGFIRFADGSPHQIMQASQRLR